MAQEVVQHQHGLRKQLDKLCEGNQETAQLVQVTVADNTKCDTLVDIYCHVQQTSSESFDQG